MLYKIVEWSHDDGDNKVVQSGIHELQLTAVLGGIRAKAEVPGEPIRQFMAVRDIESEALIYSILVRSSDQDHDESADSLVLEENVPALDLFRAIDSWSDLYPMVDGWTVFGRIKTEDTGHKMTNHTIFAEPANGSEAKVLEQGVPDAEVKDAVQSWIDVYPTGAWHIYSMPEE